MESLNAVQNLKNIKFYTSNNNNTPIIGRLIKSASEKTSYSSSTGSPRATTMTPIHFAQSLGSQTDRISSSSSSSSSSRSNPSNDIASRDTFVVLMTLTIISITLYFSYYLWKKHRHRDLLCDSSSTSKLVEYRYSRLSQNEVDVDNVQFSDPLFTPEDPLFDTTEEADCDEILTPATLHLDFTTISDKDNSPSSDIEKRQFRHSIISEQINSSSSLLLDNLSDEDLLQG